MGRQPDSTVPITTHFVGTPSVLRLSSRLKAPPACLWGDPWNAGHTPQFFRGHGYPAKTGAQTVLGLRLPLRIAPSACKPGTREAPARLRSRERFRPASLVLFTATYVAWNKKLRKLQSKNLLDKVEIMVV